MSQDLTVAVFPVAGLGTRLLPATKAIPKEVLAVVDKPLIQYAVDEALEAGFTELVFVTARGKTPLEDYFDTNPGLDATLQRGGKTALLDAIAPIARCGERISYIRQQEALGLGHAVLCARQLVGRRPFAVILPDDLILSQTPCLAQMREAHARHGGSVLATMEVAPEAVSSYGILDVARADGPLLELRGMVEKPSPEAAPSRQAVIGRYILAPEVMENLRSQGPGAGGEIQLTDAIARQMAQNPGSVRGLCFEGQRFDCGSKAGLMQAAVAVALEHPEIGTDFRAYLEACLRAPARPRKAGHDHPQSAPSPARSAVA